MAPVGKSTLNGLIKIRYDQVGSNTSSTSVLEKLHEYYGDTNISYGILLFHCSALPTDFPSGINKYGRGIAMACGYYDIIFFYNDDNNLFIGRKVYSAQSWTWRKIATTAA